MDIDKAVFSEENPRHRRGGAKRRRSRSAGVGWFPLKKTPLKSPLVQGGTESIEATLAQDLSNIGSSPLIPDDELFVRMTRSERLQHIVLIICFVLLVLTGLPLMVDPSVWLKGVFFFETSFAWRGWLHRVGGVGLIALSVVHLFYITCTQRGRNVFWALMPKLKDVTDAIEAFGHNLGITWWLFEKGFLQKFFQRHPYWLFEKKPQYGRYNFIEKFEYLAVWWGNLIMIVSGCFLWATNVSFRLFPIWVYDIFKIVHSYEAILAFLAIIIWHLYNVHLNPDVFPMNRVWLDGKLTGEELRRDHPLEYAALLEQRRLLAASTDIRNNGMIAGSGEGTSETRSARKHETAPEGDCKTQ